MSAFNDGDIELLLEITDEVALSNCIVDIKALNRRFIGIESLKSLWKALFEAFPDGNFRFSDTTVDHHLNLMTSFQFSGVKIFPIHIIGGSLINPTVDMSASKSIEPTMLGSSIVEASVQSGPFEGIQNIVDAFYHTDNTLPQVFSSIDRMNYRDPSSFGDSDVANATSPVCFAQIDTSAPLHTSAELLQTERSSVYTTNGKMVLHISSEGYVERFVFDWDRLCK